MTLCTCVRLQHVQRDMRGPSTTAKRFVDSSICLTGHPGQLSLAILALV